MSLIIELREAGKIRAKRRAAEREATAVLAALVVEGRRLGMSEVELAEQAGVTRRAVRRWLGK